jgi:hypothetical protein
MVELVGWNIPAGAKQLAVPPSELDRVTAWHPQVAGTVAVRLEPHPTITQDPANSRQQPQAVSLPVTISGRLDRKARTHAYRFDARKGQKLLFQAEAQDLDFATDAVLRVLDDSGKSLGQAEATMLGRDPELAFTVPQDGAYVLEIRDRLMAGGPRHLYRLRAVLAEPAFALTVTSDRFVAMPGKPLDIPVVVDRRNGFKDEIELLVEGLPPGATTTTAVTPKTTTLRLDATDMPASVPIRITGRVKGQEGPGQVVRAPLAGLNPANTHIWLTIPKPPAK